MTVTDSLPHVLIEIGAYNTRVGFAMDQDPKKVYRTMTKSLYDQFREIFDEVLNIDPSLYNVIILKNTGTDKDEIQQEADMLFNEFKVQGCAFCNSQTAILFSWAHGYNGLIIDIGYEKTICIPILKCMPQFNLAKFSMLAGKFLEDHVINLLNKHGLDKNIIKRNKEILLEKLMKSYFFFECREDEIEFNQIEGRKNNLENTLEIDDTKEGKLYFTLPSPLLSEDILLNPKDAQEVSFIECMVDFVNKSFAEIGIKKLERIIVCGEGGKILGLRAILKRHLLKKTDLDRAIKNYDIGIQIVPVTYQTDSWLGASIIFAMNYSKDFFKKAGEKIDFIDSKLEKQIDIELKNSDGVGKYG